jgi:carotenoid cleavage dioxygenase-like enzyme
LFPIIPQICDVERMKKGGEHWQWDSTIPIYIGVLPRRGASGSDIKVSPFTLEIGLRAGRLTLWQWFRAPNGFPGHVSNAYEDESGHIVLDLPISTQNVFFWWPDAEGKSPPPQTITSSLSRFLIDPSAPALNLDLPSSEILLPKDVEFPRIDDRFLMTKYTTSFLCLMDPSLGTDFPFISRVMGGGFPPYNALAKLNVQTGKHEVFFPGPRYLVQESVFVPRKGSVEEGDGFLMALLNNYEEMISELVVLDTKNFSQRLALVKLPMSLRAGLHGNWVDAADADGHPGSVNVANGYV